MSSNECLVGISNLDWTDCCGTSRWHGNTLSFGQPSSVFGYVAGSTSGYDASYPNSNGTTWGCIDLNTSASRPSGCSTLYVACTPWGLYPGVKTAGRCPLLVFQDLINETQLLDITLFSLLTLHVSLSYWNGPTGC